MREYLYVNEPNLLTSLTVVCRRAKEKRLKKDAGRTRWSQYFRSMKGGGSPRHDKLLDKDELKIDLDSFSHHGECVVFFTCPHGGVVQLGFVSLQI